MIMSWRKASVILLAFLGTGTDALAEGWVYFKPIGGELSFGYEGSWRDLDNGTSSFESEFEERLRLDIGGSVLDRRILVFDFDLEPVLTQNLTDTGMGTEHTGGTDLNYGGRIGFLHGVAASPLSLDADFRHATSDVDGALGSRSELTRDERGAALRWKLRALPQSLLYDESFLDELFVPAFGQPPTRREEFQRTVGYRAQNSKMNVLLENTEFDDETALDNDYESQEARLNNNFRWGKGSHLQSRMSYFNREGFSAYESSSISENLQLQHTDKLFTTYGFTVERTKRTTESETRRGDFGLNHELYTNLTTSLSFSRFVTDSDEFQEDRSDVALDFRYRKKFGEGPAVSANLGGGYRVSDRVGGRVDFSETPTVPASGIVVLAQRYIVVSTIIVTAPGCNPCLEVTDYLVEDAGNDFTQLRIPAGSRINIGDTITVDYVYEPPTVEFYSVPYRFGVRLDYGSIAFYHRTNGEDQTFVEGPDPNAVSDQRTDTTGVEWNWVEGRNRARASAERIFTLSASQNNTEYVLRQSVNYGIARNTSLSASLSESYLIGDTDVTAFNGDAAITWTPRRGLAVEPNTTAFYRTSDPGVTEGFLEVGVDVTWNWRRITVEMDYDHTLRHNDGSVQIDDSLMLNLKRKF